MSLASEHRTLGAANFGERLARWVAKYPIVTIEDSMAENDWDGWSLLTHGRSRTS